MFNAQEITKAHSWNTHVTNFELLLVCGLMESSGKHNEDS